MINNFKSYFPINYKPKYDLDKTISFINDFNLAFISMLEERFNSIQVDYPLISHVDGTNMNDCIYRKISFDNASSKLPYIVNSENFDYFKQLGSKLNISSDKSLIAKTKLINRDSKLTNTDSLIKDVLYLYTTQQTTHNEFKDSAKSLIESIVNSFKIIFNEELLKKYNITDKDIENINVANIKDIIPKRLRQEEYSQYIDMYLSSKGPTLILGTDDATLNEFSECNNKDLTKNNETASLYIYIPKIKSRIRLLKFYSLNISIREDIGEHRFLVAFDLSNFYMYLLDKLHIAEVVASVWDDEFIQFTKTNNIKIL